MTILQEIDKRLHREWEAYYRAVLDRPRPPLYDKLRIAPDLRAPLLAELDVARTHLTAAGQWWYTDFGSLLIVVDHTLPLGTWKLE